MKSAEIEKLLDAEYAEQLAARKEPTRSPSRHRFWMAFRLYGVLFRRPARAAWNWFRHSEYVCPCHESPRLDDFGWCGQAHQVYRFAFSERVKDWLNGCSYKRPFRLWLNRLLTWGYGCPCCGSDAWADDAYDNDSEHFELIDSGRGQGPDGATFWFGGWAYCFHCGSVAWFEDSGP